uniref:T-complex protein 1 subunit delta n=1 Tax=Ascaris lumbricoides TaxID=6252 RepID=A0A0M3IJ26_ASCLU
MIKVVKKIGETVEESRLVEGALIDQKSMGRGGPTRVEKAQIGLIQFQLSPPKTDMEHQVIITDYAQMDRALKEERTYILDLCKQIKKAGCNVLLIQKSILRDAVNEMALHFLAKMKIMVVKDIEREDIEFYSRILGCRPVASVDHFVPGALGSADLVEEIATSGDGKVIEVTGVQNPGQAVSILLRGSNKLVLDEAERSLHDALCVLRCLVKKRMLVGAALYFCIIAIVYAMRCQIRVSREQLLAIGGWHSAETVTGVQNPGQAVSILLRGSNKLVLDEAERSLHDALCVLRCLVKKRMLVSGGGAPEMEVAVQLRNLAQGKLGGGAPEMEVAVQLRNLAQGKLGAEQYCWKAFADAMELIPYTLAENAGLSPITTVTELRNQHANGYKNYGVNFRKGYVTDIREENVLQPLLVTSTAIKQAAECVRSILKIDDIVSNLFFFYCLCFPHVVAIEMESGRGGEADERGPGY